MKIICRECNNLFEKKSRLETLCQKCWMESHRKGGLKTLVQNSPKCFKCNESILPDDDKVQIEVCKRILKIKKNNYDGAWKRNRLATFHKRCFKIDGLLK